MGTQRNGFYLFPGDPPRAGGGVPRKIDARIVHETQPR